MSADVALWDPEAYGLPRTYEEAVKTYLKLSEGIQSTSNSKLIKFAGMFESLLKDNKLDEDLRLCYQNIQRYAHDNQDALYLVGLPHSGSVDALKQIVVSAQAAGMVVFYDMMGAVFLPDGRVYPAEKAEMWRGALAHLDSPPDFPRTLKGFEKLADPLFTAMAERHGMKEHKIPFNYGDGYIREVALGQQYIKLSSEGSGGEYKVSLYAYIESKTVSEIYGMFAFSQSRLFSNNIPNSLNAENIVNYKLATNKFKEINSLTSLENAIEFMEQYAFSEFLDLAQDIKGLDAVFNTSEVDSAFNWRSGKKGFQSPHSLILARLTGNPRFEEMVKIYEADVDWGANRVPKATELPKLLEYLRNEVKPIV